MKFKISYECRANDGVYMGEIEVNSTTTPKSTDQLLVELALQDSMKLHRSGTGGITITAITPLD